MRYALAIEYCGTHYVGWQAQAGQVSIQSTLEQALSQIATHPIEVVTAGRTDRGVHASEQIIHFDSPVERTEKAWVKGTNDLLPKDIRVLWAKAVPDDFHARHRAIARRYRYFVYVNKVSPALCLNQVTWLHYPLDIEKMQAGANHLLGEHDFSSFRSSSCQSKTPMRKVHHIHIKALNDDKSLIMIDIQANAFLHNMVRNITGMLFKIGKGQLEPSQAKAILEAKDRTKAPQKAPPDGLYLVKVHYEADYGFPNIRMGPRFLAD